MLRCGAIFQAPHLALIGACGQEFADGGAEMRMPQRGGDFRERHKDKFSFCHSRMWDFQFGSPHSVRAVEQNVDIDRAWPALDETLASKFAFDFASCVQELARHQRGIYFYDAVYKPVLRCEIDRLGGVHRRFFLNVDAALFERRDCALDLRDAIAEVGTQRKINGVGLIRGRGFHFSRRNYDLE